MVKWGNLCFLRDKKKMYNNCVPGHRNYGFNSSVVEEN